MDTEKLNDKNLIEDFLDGKLSAVDEDSFRDRLKTDEEFAHLYNFRFKIAEDWQKATEYEQAKQQAKSLIKSVKRKKNRIIIIYSLAASLTLLIAIPGIIFFNKQINNTANTTNNKEQGGEKRYKTHIELQENKASINYLDTIILVSPVNNSIIRLNDSIIFKWTPPADSIENLIIENRINGKIILDNKITKGMEIFGLPPSFLPVGEYSWYIKRLSTKGSFRIVK